MSEQKQLTITYFPIAGRAEPARLALAEAGVAFNDVRIGGEDWVKAKPTMPFGQMPVLTLEDGTQISDSLNILFYVGEKYGLVPDSPEERALGAAIVYAVNDVLNAVVGVMFGPEEAKEAGFAKLLADDGKVQTTLKFLNDGKLGKKGTPFFSDKCTIYDIFVYTVLTSLAAKMPPVNDIVAKFDKVAALVKATGERPNIKAWVDAHPER